MRLRLFLTSLVLLVLVGTAWAQRGLYISPGCTQPPTPVTGYSWCFDATAGSLKTWTGATWVSVSVTAPVSVANGGTGVTSLTSNQIPYGNGTGAFQSSSNLTFNGTTLTANILNLTNPLTVPYGGTGLTSLTASQIPYGNGTGNLSSSSSLTFDGTKFIVGSSGPHAFGTTTTDSQVGFRLLGPATAAGSNATAAMSIGGTQTAHANSDVLVGLGDWKDPFLFATGTYTGLTAAGIRLTPGSWTSNGTGAISTAVGLDILNAPTIGTTNYSLRVAAGNVRLGGLIIQSASQGVEVNGQGTLTDGLYGKGAGSGLAIKTAGTDALVIGNTQGIQAGAPTGGDKGVGTINVASNYYINGVLAHTTSGSPVLLNGSAGGDYTVANASTSYVDVDATNLKTTITTPASATIMVSAVYGIVSGTSNSANIALLVDGAANTVWANFNNGSLQPTGCYTKYAIVTGLSAAAHTFSLGARATDAGNIIIANAAAALDDCVAGRTKAQMMIRVLN